MRSIGSRISLSPGVTPAAADVLIPHIKEYNTASEQRGQ
jgi:hypothetical protein